MHRQNDARRMWKKGSRALLGSRALRMQTFYCE
jgi:hypothetical protein